jgi:hypothetical protein
MSTVVLCVRVRREIEEEAERLGIDVRRVRGYRRFLQR